MIGEFGVWERRESLALTHPSLRSSRRDEPDRLLFIHDDDLPVALFTNMYLDVAGLEA